MHRLAVATGRPRSMGFYQQNAGLERKLNAVRIYPRQSDRDV
jgi:hypothetical protein